jgi:hypothetical protein
MLGPQRESGVRSTEGSTEGSTQGPQRRDHALCARPTQSRKKRMTLILYRSFTTLRLLT